MISKPVCSCWVRDEHLIYWYALPYRIQERWDETHWFFCPHCGCKAFAVTPNIPDPSVPSDSEVPEEVRRLLKPLSGEGLKGEDDE